jgi:hypothetical protein
MSINSMTNAALARRSDYPPADTVPKSPGEVATAANNDPTPPNTVSTALKTLTTYIPTETLTLYVFFVGLLEPLDPARPSYTSRWLVFGLFLAFTLLAIWAAFAAKLTSDHKALPRPWRTWPKWEMTAGSLAYDAWELGLPDSPFAMIRGLYSPAIASVIVLLVSAGLGIVAPLFQRPLAKTDP